ncbi:MAG: substrate-binding domain-containing protein [Polyangiaceae bacterium]|nr:substrate-binding domain-containing protein [Polyangiaceae bacterium]
MTSRRQVLGLIGLGLAAAACRRSAPTGGEAGKAPRIAVIPKGTTHEFWKSVHAGAVKASQELGVEIVWKGPLKEDDLKSQIDLVQSFVAQRISGIVLAPLDSKGLRGAVKDAVRSGIPVVVFDSALDSADPISYVATDNRAAGRLAGERMVEALGGQGKLVVLRYQEGSASTHEREEGFLEAVRKAVGVQVVSDNQYSGPTTESAYAASESLLLAQRAAQGDIAGVFAPNESSTFGMLLALEKARIAGRLRFVGFDASTKLVAGLRDGKIHGLVVQNPLEMGYRSTKALALHLRGEKIEAKVDTGSTFVTAKNLDLPEIKQLVAPDLSRWLGAAG